MIFFLDYSPTKDQNLHKIKEERIVISVWELDSVFKVFFALSCSRTGSVKKYIKIQNHKKCLRLSESNRKRIENVLWFFFPFSLSLSWIGQVADVEEKKEKGKGKGKDFCAYCIIFHEIV